MYCIEYISGHFSKFLHLAALFGLLEKSKTYFWEYILKNMIISFLNKVYNIYYKYEKTCWWFINLKITEMYCINFLPSDYLVDQKRLSPIVAFCSLKFSLNIAINKKNHSSKKGYKS